MGLGYSYISEDDILDFEIVRYSESEVIDIRYHLDELLK